MAKLKNIIMQLSDADYLAVHESLSTGGAEKSAYLLKSMRESSSSDHAIMEELEVNTNAYYTLRSRLNQKIEEYLLQQMENPRTDILKKVANINEIIFTKKKAIAIATLKKLEKELIDYDLSNELTIVYKALKKLHQNTEEYFGYSQLYNRHVAYMLAVDKAEDLLSNYFIKFGNYSLTGDETNKLELVLLNKEMLNTCKIYDSHRLFIYKNCLNIFHRLFVEEDETSVDLDPIEDILAKADGIFELYSLDSIYFHLTLVYEFLKLEYYNHYRLHRKAENYFEEVNESCASFLSNFNLFTYPAQFLITKIQRAKRMPEKEMLSEENVALFQDFEPDRDDIPQYITYATYRSLSCHFDKKYEESAKWLNNLLNDVSLKKYQNAQLEIKTLLALEYCLMKDYELFNQLINSIQRQIRIIGKENCMNIQVLNKIMKISLSESKRNKEEKISELVKKFKSLEPVQHFAPTLLLEFNDDLIKKLVL
ncbi:hypothetical protein SAMN05661096_01069 [Marivirga sericea]|uniref:Uncharacterized protein n=1 Tax=Marivirga sericea TaxID=1028 RepID=A0A1X7IYS6_9BACT|nr:hypothetical protein [Marivirga sericea]SMG20049.1 hypothetical protein SAMN05661096_01069 [Marivirga sericea]